MEKCFFSEPRDFFLFCSNIQRLSNSFFPELLCSFWFVLKTNFYINKQFQCTGCPGSTRLQAAHLLYKISRLWVMMQVTTRVVLVSPLRSPRHLATNSALLVALLVLTYTCKQHWGFEWSLSEESGKLGLNVLSREYSSYFFMSRWGERKPDLIMLENQNIRSAADTASKLSIIGRWLNGRAFENDTGSNPGLLFCTNY